MSDKNEQTTRIQNTVTFKSMMDFSVWKVLRLERNFSKFCNNRLFSFSKINSNHVILFKNITQTLRR